MDILTEAAGVLKSVFLIEAEEINTQAKAEIYAPQSSTNIHLGYFNMPVLKQIDDSKAYFLTRVQHSVKIYVDGIKHDLVSWLNAQQRGIVNCQIEMGLKDRFA